MFTTFLSQPVLIFFFLNMFVNVFSKFQQSEMSKNCSISFFIYIENKSVWHLPCFPSRKIDALVHQHQMSSVLQAKSIAAIFHIYTTYIANNTTYYSAYLVRTTVQFIGIQYNQLQYSETEVIAAIQ